VREGAASTVAQRWAAAHALNDCQAVRVRLRTSFNSTQSPGDPSHAFLFAVRVSLDRRPHHFLERNRVLRAMLRQSSYSGDALAILPDGQRAILMRTLPTRFPHRQIRVAAPPCFRAASAADGGCLAEQYVLKRGRMIGTAQHCDLHARPTLLHLHRGS